MFKGYWIGLLNAEFYKKALFGEGWGEA